jgi:CubicO group peptidase (beta-lactamase class C family)
MKVIRGCESMLGFQRFLVTASLCACLMLGAAGWSDGGEIVEGDLGGRLDAYLTAITPFGFSGAVLVARDGRVVLDKGYGMAIRSEGIANTRETVFGTGSITKQFTAAAIMKLEMQGKLNTSDRLDEYLGGVPQKKVDITLHHLLTHTAGVLPFSGNDYTIAHRDETVKKILDSPLEFVPGEHFEYSNAGYSLLAAVIEQVSGMPYEEFLNRELFVPAGMKFTGYRIPDWQSRVVAHWYTGEVDNGTPLEKDYPYWNLIGNGGILSTTGDMYKWHLALMGDEVLSEDAKAKLYSAFLNDYAYGWDVLQTDHGLLIQHDGASMFGNAAEIRRYVDAGVVTVAFCNADGERVLLQGVRDKIERIVFGEDVELPPAPVRANTEELRKFEARYDIEFGGALDVEVEGDGLRITADGHGAINVLAFPQSDDPAVLHNDLDEKSWMILDAAVRGDYGLLATELGDEGNIDKYEDIIETQLARHREETGPIRQVSIFGTVPSSDPDEVMTIVVLRGTKGAELVFRLHWRDDRLAGLSPAISLEPVSMHMVPLSATEFAGYDIVWGRGIRVDFDVDSHQSVRSLTVRTPSGGIVAIRR